MNNGRVFVHIKDLVGLEKLETDQEVRFLLYRDDKGLGASNCTSNELPQGEQYPTEEVISPGPGMGGFDNEPKTVISIYVENMYIGGIIGKKGATIKKLSQDSGANIDITQDEDGSEEKRRDPQQHRLINLTGTNAQLKTVVKAIAKTLSEISQSLYAKVTFLIHQSQAGRLIGKKGANIKKIRGDMKKVNLTISKDPVTIKGQPLVTVTVFGPCKDVESSIDETVNQLAEIYQSMLQTYNEQQMPGPPGGGPPGGWGPPGPGYGAYDMGMGGPPGGAYGAPPGGPYGPPPGGFY